MATRCEELSNPKGCFMKGPETRLKFVIDATDIAAPHTVREWVRKRIELGKNVAGDPQVTEALIWADTVESGVTERV